MLLDDLVKARRKERLSRRIPLQLVESWCGEQLDMATGRIWYVLKGDMLASKHKNHAHKFSEEAVQGVRKFIDAVPKYRSHHNRQQNPNKVYLDCDLTISSLFCDKCSTYCQEYQLPAVSESKFREIFVTEYNIGFKIPKSDTCPKCDSFLITVSNSELPEDELAQKKLQYELHLRRAESGQDMISSLTALAKENPQQYHVIAMDMHQTLPTPKLTAGPAFYKLKLWMYNYEIHDCGTNKGYMFLWSENEGGRGSDEVGSCLIKYLEIAKPHAKELHITARDRQRIGL
ncbi:uncharacterized protein [Anabrus simplex]|uniref:uncharacterized protein n=1 Tax=Anabrus simplex TaxID=316456 RepID=UPI0035A2815F